MFGLSFGAPIDQPDPLWRLSYVDMESIFHIVQTASGL